MQNKKVINIGDVFLTDIRNLVFLEFGNFDNITEIEPEFEDSNEYVTKSIFTKSINEIDRLCDRALYIFIKYIGEGKFEELETRTIILCQGNREMEDYYLVDDDKLEFRSYTAYKTYQQIRKDIVFVKRSPLVLSSTETTCIKPISKVSDEEKNGLY